MTVCPDGLPRPTTIAISGSTLYVALADDTDPRIVMLPVGCAPTTAPTRLMSAPRGVDGLFVDPPNLWFTAFFDGSVYRAPADGSGPATRIAVKQDTLGQIVATPDAIYYAAGASVMRIPR